MLFWSLLMSCAEGTCEPASIGSNCAPVELCCTNDNECWYRFDGYKYDCLADELMCTYLVCDACEFGYTATDELVCPYED